MQEACLPRALARDSAGKSIAARMAMIAITTSNSISVNARPALQVRRLTVRPVVGMAICDVPRSLVRAQAVLFKCQRMEGLEKAGRE